jgi:hypothetical protein
MATAAASANLAGPAVVATPIADRPQSPRPDWPVEPKLPGRFGPVHVASFQGGRHQGPPRMLADPLCLGRSPQP